MRAHGWMLVRWSRALPRTSPPCGREPGAEGFSFGARGLYRQEEGLGGYYSWPKANGDCGAGEGGGPRRGQMRETLGTWNAQDWTGMGTREESGMTPGKC